jgi:hypothetical protein
MTQDQPKRGRGRPPGPEKPPKPAKFRWGDAQRPALWKSGPDELRHDIYNAFLKRKAQAKYRGEIWAMTYEEFYDLWKNDWHNKGRLSHQVCMGRHDPEKEWSRSNTYIRLRYDQLLEQAKKRIGNGRIQRGLK